VPELPDIRAYLAALEPRVVGQVLRDVKVASPFVLRSFDPPLSAAFGQRVTGVRRIGKRIVFALGDDLFVVVHLMIAGRFRWKDDPGAKPPARVGLAAFHFDRGTLLLTEASKKKRAAIHLVRGEDALAEHDPGGVDVLAIDRDTFAAVLQGENHTVKRTLTDPHFFDGIGNAYSDEVLHRARLSPVKWTTKLTGEEIDRLYAAARETLTEWVDRLVGEAEIAFPEKVTAFRPEMAVHGKYKEPCPVCGSPVQRIVKGDNEFNYCPGCQTGGKLLADRSLSRLMKSDWPKTLEEYEELKARKKAAPPAKKTTPRST